MKSLADLRFSHLVVGVTDMDRALRFYRDLLGMDVVFDQTMSGEPFDRALGGSGEHEGRVVGGLVGGNQNISLSVTDLDDTHRQVRAAGYEPDQEPFAIAGVRMFFVKDPDGTAVEFIEFPGSARTSEELHRGGR